MANRVLRDWTTSERIDSLSMEAEVFFTRLIMKADDHGCFHANPKLLKAALFPLKDISFGMIEILLKECESCGILQIYEAEGRKYLKINEFNQRLRNMVSKFPQPADNPLTIDSKEPPETKRNEVETNPEGEGEYLPQIGIDKAIQLITKDEIWIGNIRPLARGKDIPESVRAAFLFLESKPQRFKTATINDLKSTTISWLENKKPVQATTATVYTKGRAFGEGQ